MIRFKPYITPAIDGTPVVFSCEHLNENDLVKMLSKPRHLIPISFQAAHQLYGDIIYDFLTGIDDNGIEKLIELANRGFIDVIADLGFRIVPSEKEIEIFF